MFGAVRVRRHPHYFPSPRDEITGRLQQGDAVLHDAMHRHERHFRRGHLLVRLGERQDAIYRLVSGAVARVRIMPDGQRQIICFFTPGDLIAVRAILTDRLPDNIEVLSSAIVHSLDTRAATELASRHCEVAMRFLWQAAEDERRLRNNMVMLAKADAKQRISTMLVDILGRLAVASGDDEPRLVVSLRQQDIADYLGLTVVHVNRTLRALRQEGAIEVRVGAIAIRDRAAIVAYAMPLLDLYEVAAPEFTHA